MGGRGASSSAGAGGRGVPNEATEYYVSGEGMWINQYLRGNGDFGELSPEETEYLADLDKATDAPLKDGTLYRSVDASVIFGELPEGEIENVIDRVVHGASVYDNGAYSQGLKRSAEQTINKTIGKTTTEKGFMSTTSDFEIAEEFRDFTGATNPVVMRIKTNGKARGVNLSRYDRNVSPDMAQKERLLARNTKYKINGISANENGTVIVDVTL